LSKKELFKDILKAFNDVKLVVSDGNLFHVGTTRDAKQNLRVSHLHSGRNSLYGWPLVSIGQVVIEKKSLGLRIVF